MKLCIPDMPNEAYHKHPAISRSLAGQILRSPAHYQHSLVNGTAETDAMRLGTRIHGALLESEKFWASVVVWAGPVRRGKEWDAFRERHADREILTVSEEAQLLKITEAFRGQAFGERLRGQVEQSYFWQKDGLQLKCRPDIVGVDGYLYDLKSTYSATAEAFAGSVKKWGYHRQAAWYLAGVEAVTGVRPKGFIFVAIEKSAPYASQMFVLDELALTLGRVENETALAKIALCQLHDHWPGYGDELAVLSLPETTAVELEE